MRHILSVVVALTFAMNASAQMTKVYNESVDPMAQIDSALTVARQTDKFVVCQVGGNWCPWCLRFADFIKRDTAVAKTIADNFVYIHVNYPRKGVAADLMARLGHPARFGFPVMVVMDADGKVLHTQDSSFLETGQGYDAEKVLRFFTCWTPKAVRAE